jgi:two-component system, NarL family, nitrate/nitrite response regulator NarL
MMTTTSDVSILIADDHKMVRDGLRLMLSLENKRKNYFITEATDGAEAVSIAIQKKFDIILLDYRMPKFNGDNAVQRILVHQPDAKIIMLSNYDERAFVQNSVRNGAKGYLLKDVNTDELVTAINTVLSGETYYATAVRDKLSDSSEEENEINFKQLGKQFGISEREMEILLLIAKEFTNEEISKQLDISKRTVDTHRQNLLYKLNVKNTAGLVKFVYSNHILMR